MPRAGLNPEAVVEAALGVVDEQGAGALTLAAVAARTGVAAPSLYKHVGGVAELRSLVAARVMDDLTAALHRALAGRGPHDAVPVLMHAYRRYVVDHPTRYAAVPPDPMHGQVPALVAAGTRQLEVVLAVLAGYGLEGEDLVHTARVLRAAVHGFASLESEGGFGLAPDLDASYDLLVRSLVTGLLPTRTSPTRTPPTRTGPT